MDAKQAFEILNGGANNFEQTMDAIAVAAKSLQKQIPQKPIRIVFDPDFPFGKCPRCEKVNCKTEYCSNCGQKFDWSEEQNTEEIKWLKSE